MQLKYNLLKNPTVFFTQVRSPSYSNRIQYVAVQGKLPLYYLVRLHKIVQFLNRQQLGLHHECLNFYSLWANFFEKESF